MIGSKVYWAAHYAEMKRIQDECDLEDTRAIAAAIELVSLAAAFAAFMLWSAGVL